MTAAMREAAAKVHPAITKAINAVLIDHAVRVPGLASACADAVVRALPVPQADEGGAGQREEIINNPQIFATNGAPVGAEEITPNGDVERVARAKAIFNRILVSDAITGVADLTDVEIPSAVIRAMLEFARQESEVPLTLPRDQIEAETDGWRPIETAPKDGTRVDLWVENEDGAGPDGVRIPDCYWGRPQHTCGEAGRYCDSCPSRDGWCDGFGYVTDGNDGGVTHFRYPPAPPVRHPDAGGDL